jgi:hypothetical protein
MQYTRKETIFLVNNVFDLTVLKTNFRFWKTNSKAIINSTIMFGHILLTKSVNNEFWKLYNTDNNTDMYFLT